VHKYRQQEVHSQCHTQYKPQSDQCKQYSLTSNRRMSSCYRYTVRQCKWMRSRNALYTRCKSGLKGRHKHSLNRVRAGMRMLSTSQSSTHKLCSKESTRRMIHIQVRRLDLHIRSRRNGSIRHLHRLCWLNTQRTWLYQQTCSCRHHIRRGSCGNPKASVCTLQAHKQETTIPEYSQSQD
jgi:hypothetical protein